MAIELLVGKPGSGKSYHAVTMLLNDLRIARQSVMNTGEEYPRKIFTNLPLNIEAIDDHLNDEHKKKPFDYTKYIVIFDRQYTATFWQHVKSYGKVYLDEAQKAFPRDNEEGHEAFIQYSALHRHEGHDIVLMTQHVDLMDKEILATAVNMLEILNAKAKTFKTSGIKIEDFLVVLNSFGHFGQLYYISTGIIRGKAVKWTEGGQFFYMKELIFKLYNSFSREGEHGGSVVSDRPATNMTRWQAIKWLLYKYRYSLMFRSSIPIGIILCVPLIMYGVPYFLDTTSKSMIQPSSKHIEKKPLHKSVKSKNNRQSHDPISTQIDAQTHLKDQEILSLKTKIEDQNKQVQKLSAQIEALKRVKKVIGVFDNGIILQNGERYDIGDKLTFNGEDYFVLDAVNQNTGLVVFSDGTEVRVR